MPAGQKRGGQYGEEADTERQKTKDRQRDGRCKERSGAEDVERLAVVVGNSDE